MLVTCHKVTSAVDCSRWPVVQRVARRWEVHVWVWVKECPRDSRHASPPPHHPTKHPVSQWYSSLPVSHRIWVNAETCEEVGVYAPMVIYGNTARQARSSGWPGRGFARRNGTNSNRPGSLSVPASCGSLGLCSWVLLPVDMRQNQWSLTY